MPLVIPGINDNDHRPEGHKTWQDRLIGKKIGETSDVTTFAQKDLPKNSRVIPHAGMATADFDPDRINIHLDKDGIVNEVKKG